MPEMNIGSLQGSALPIYLTVKTFAGDLVPQLPNGPTIEIIYIDTNHVKQDAVRPTKMVEIEPGRYYYVWRIRNDEPLIPHKLIMSAVLEDQEIAPEAPFMTTELVQQPFFILEVDIVKNKGLCYPEVMAHTPKCRRHPHITKWQREEVDIGLDDRAIEGAFRFGEFPNSVVDRRVVGKLSYSIGIGGNVSSETPGAGPAQRPGDPMVDGSYRQRTKYRYQ